MRGALLLSAAMISMMVIIGHMFQFEPFTSWSGDGSYVDMMPVTALSGILLAIAVWLVPSQDVRSEAVAGSSAVMVMALMFIKTTDSALGDDIESSLPVGVPSIGAAVAFFLMLGGLMAFVLKQVRWQAMLSLTALTLSNLAILGYALEIPSLYYWFPKLPKYSAAMAVNTSAVVTMLSVALLMTKEPRRGRRALSQ